uniref:Predicted protein n=1 Tax=Hordeum vulgare subsp. vulgare TaxID=112509 RepID=F2DDX4_HORVV|nr:predicted protein [Hordeum vulgare subsp. vulgare]
MDVSATESGAGERMSRLPRATPVGSGPLPSCPLPLCLRVKRTPPPTGTPATKSRTGRSREAANLCDGGRGGHERSRWRRSASRTSPHCIR